MRRFLGQWVILGIVHAAVGSAIGIGIFHSVDLRFSTFAGFVLIPAFQSLVLMWTFPSHVSFRAAKTARNLPRTDADRPVAGDPSPSSRLRMTEGLWTPLAAFILVAALPVGYGPWARAIVACVAAIAMLRRAPLLSIALLAAAANVPFQWMAKVTPLIHAPTVWQWIIVYGGGFAIYVLLVLCHPERSEGAGRRGGAPPVPPAPSPTLGMTHSSLIPAILAAIVVSFNIFYHPYLTPGWTRVANGLGAASFAMIAEAGIDTLFSAGELLATIVVVFVVVPLWFTPWRVSCAIARGYGAVAFVVWGKARRAGMMNLRRALGMSASEARRATFTVFANLGQSIAEGLQFVRRYRDNPEAWRRFCRVEDPELAKRILDDPRPKIFVTSHLGSWEVATMIVDLAAGGRGAGIARRVDNRWLDALVKRVRLRDRAQWIEKRGAATEALHRLASGESVMMLLDENGGPRGPFVPFFGRLSSTRKTPAVLSMRTGAPIVVGAVVRDETKPQPSFVFRLALIDRAEDIVATTARINSVIESWIREAPLQWRWIHWRWRTRPDGSEEGYSRRDLRACFAEEV